MGGICLFKGGAIFAAFLLMLVLYKCCFRKFGKQTCLKKNKFVHGIKHLVKKIPSLKLTFLPLKMDGWKLEDEISFWDGPIFRSYC